MSIPGAMMPGQGGPPPDMGGMGGAGGPGGGPDAILKLLASFQQQPSPDAEKKMLQEAVTMISGAYPKLQLRSAKAARMISEAQAKIQGALEALSQEGQKGLAPPPDLGMGMPGMGGM